MAILDISTVTSIISLLGGIALFLFGMSLMGDSLKKVAGNKLEVILYKLSGTPLRGLLLGTGVTAVIQSSSATSIMVVGFVNSGMMKVRQSIGVILGSILGTSVTGWIISLSYIGESSGWISLISTSTLTAIIAVIGIVLRMFCKEQFKQRIGDILLGFAVLMFGMQSMSSSVGFLKESESFISLLTAFSNPLLGILVGVAFTSILQSASAAVGILQALSVTGAIDFAIALPIIMGIAIGAAVPVLLSALGATTDGKRTAFIYLITQIIGVGLIGILFYATDAIFHYSFMGPEAYIMNPVRIALINTLFRLIMVAMLMPFTKELERLVVALIKEKGSRPQDEDMMRLEERFIQHPALAIEQSRLTINSMAKTAEENLVAAFALLDHYTDKDFDLVRDLEQTVDRYEDALGTYLVKITGRDMTSAQNEEVSKFLHTLSDFERISDHALNIGEAAQEIHQKKLKFSDSASHELRVISSAVSEVVNLAVTAFVKNDLVTAARVEPLEELIDNLCDELKLHHIDRLQKGSCTLTQGFVFNDLLTNFERIADHCSNIAVAMIELQSDSFDTHEYLSSLKDMKDATFSRYYTQYAEKYVL